MAFKLIEQFPEFADELAELLRQEGEDRLAETVPALVITDRCRCGEYYCATMFTADKSSGRPEGTHRTIAPKSESSGYVIVHVSGETVSKIETISRYDVGDRLVEVLP